MSDDFVPGPNSEAATGTEANPGPAEETPEEHAHPRNDQVPEDAVEQKRVHEETSPLEEPGDERPDEG